MKNKLRIFKSKLKGNINNSRGWRTNRRFLIIESDDWGSIRMPSKKVFNNFVNKGFGIENSLYNKYDSLASEEDLSALFDTLSSFKDVQGNSPIITANTVVANPDFKKIEKNDFQSYFYEPFTKTLKEYSKHHKSFDLWKEGMNASIFKPQFHAREHLNIELWMQALQSNNDVIQYTFKEQTTYSGKDDYSFMDAFDFEDKKELDSLKKIAIDGLNLFEKILGFRSKSFIAPCYIWHPEIENTLSASGIKYFQGMRNQLVPTNTHFKYDIMKHKMGDRNELNQLYFTRNATFEPSSVEGMDWVNYCFNQIETAFTWKKPAIITSHRVNFIGFLEEDNRNKSLKSLEQLIKKVLKRWPDVEFISSDELGDIMMESKKS